MAKKKKGIGASFRQQVEQVPVVQQKAPRTISTNVSTGGGGLGASLRSATKTATQKAEEERSARMRQGLSSIVRSSFNRKMSQPTTIQKGFYQNVRNVLEPVKNRTFVTGGHGVGTTGFKAQVRNSIAPAKELAKYTRTQEVRYATPSQDASLGRSNIDIERAHRLQAGMPSTSNFAMSWREKPTEKEIEYRGKYGYDKAFTDKQINERLDDSGINRDKNPLPKRVQSMHGSNELMAAKEAIPITWDDFRSGFSDAWALKNAEDTAKKQYGIDIDEDTLAQLEAQRGTFGYGTGMAAGQMAQYALTRGLLSGAGLVGRGAKATETAAQAFRREMAIDQAASLPLNIIDAMKEDNLDGMIKRFGMNQGLDLAFGILTEVPSLAKNRLFKSAQAKNIAAQEAEQAGDTVTASAMRQSAKRDLDSIPTEELDKAQDEIRDATESVAKEQPTAKPQESIAKGSAPERSAHFQKHLDNPNANRQRGVAKQRENALATMKDGEKRKGSFYINVGKVNGETTIGSVNGEFFKQNGIVFGVHKGGRKEKFWFVTDVETGMPVGTGKTKKEALSSIDESAIRNGADRQRAVNQFQKEIDNKVRLDDEQLRKVINSYEGMSDSELMAEKTKLLDTKSSAKEFEWQYDERVSLIDDILNSRKKSESIAEEPKQLYNEPRGDGNGTEQFEPRNARETGGAEEVRADVGTVQNGERQATGGAHLEDATDSASTGRTGRTLSLTNEQRAVMDAAGKTNANLREADYSAFSNALNEGKASNKYGSYVDPQDVDELTKKGAKTFLSDDGSVGFAVTKDGDMIGAFNRGGKYRGAVDDMLITARLNGGTKLDCYGAGLVNKYEQAGYVPVARIPFNPEYVDDPLLLANKPDVYVMMKNSDDIDTVIRKNANGEYHLSTQDELDNLRSFDDYDEALDYRDNLLKQQDSPKDGLGRDIFEGQPRYKPSGAGRDEKFWKKVTKKYEKKSTDWLNAEKLSLPSKVTKNKMGESEMIERSKLIDSLIDEKARYRHGTLKEVDGTKVSQAYDTLSHSDKTKRIRDELQRTFIDEGTGRKQGMNPKQAAEDAVARVENDPDAIKLKLLESNDTALKGKFPAKYDNSQEYYADALAYLNHNDSLMEQLEEQGLKNTSQYELLKSDAVKITNGVMAYRSSEGYGAIQYNMLCRSSGEMRVAVVQKAVDDINQQFEKQLEKAAKKEGKKLTEKDKIRIKLTDDAIKKLKGVNPDSPLEMSKAMHEISEDIWNQVPAAFKEEADAIRMTSMLLNPKTHIRNFIGNAFMIPARIMKDILGAPLEKAATKIKFRGESILNPEDATKAVVNRFSKKDKPYFDAAKQVWEEWKDYVRGDMKYFDTVTPTASRLLGSRPVGSGRVFTAGRENPAAWRRVADAIINFNGRLLEGSDALFLKYHFTDSFAQVCKARNLDPTKLTSQELQEVISAATGEAQRATFRDVSEAAKLINGLKASKPDDALIKKGVAWATSTTMPFVNTPINILRRSWDYSPAGLIHGCAEIVQGVGKGNSKEVKKGIDRMCSGLTGSGICIVGFLLGRDGGLTAKLSEGSEGYYEQDQGFQEYSINLEGKDGIDVPFLELENEDGVSVSLSSFAPLVIPLFTGVEVANWWGDDKEVDWSAVGRAADTIGRIFDPTMDMSVMQGPMGVLKAIQDADDLKTAPIDVGLNIAINHYMQYIPTAFGQAARIADPTRRDLSSTKSSYFDKQLEKAKLKFQSRIPSTPLTDNSLYNISSTGIQPYKDAWGREQKTLEGHPVKRFFYETVSPSYIREKNITELDEEITRLNKAATQEEKVIPTKFFGNEISFNGGKVGVDRKDITVYNEFRGKSAYAAASKLIGTDAYKTASDTEKRNMLNEVFKNANTEGKQNMLLSKGYSAKAVYTEGFEGGKKENADNVFNAGVAPKRYYELMTDKSVDLNGNGSKSQYEVYTYLQDTDLTDAQKAAIWNSYNKGWKNNPYAGGYIPTADGGKSGSNSGSSKRGRSGRRSSGGSSSKTKKREKTASEKKFAALQTGKAPTNAKGIEALSGARGLTKAQKKALVKLMQKKLDV